MTPEQQEYHEASAQLSEAIRRYMAALEHWPPDIDKWASDDPGREA